MTLEKRPRDSRVRAIGRVPFQRDENTFTGLLHALGDSQVFSARFIHITPDYPSLYRIRSALRVDFCHRPWAGRVFGVRGAGYPGITPKLPRPGWAVRPSPP